MFCKHCGNQLGDEDKFCGKCGKQTTENVALFSNATDGVLKKLTLNSRKLITCTIIVVVVICIIWAISYFNSVAYLEKKLAENTWYQTPYFGSYGRLYGSVIEFHLNGDTEIAYYVQYGGDWTSSNHRSPSWEIMDDKRLYFDGGYYDWKEEWSLSGNELRIGEDIYYITDTYKYEED